MTLRYWNLLVGGAAGAVGATSCLVASRWLGPAAVGLATLTATALGAVAALAGAVRLEGRFRAQLDALDDPVLPADVNAPPFGAPEIDERLETIRRSVRRVRQSAAETEEVGRVARTLWSSVHGAGTPVPDPVRCITALFDLFRQTAENLQRHTSSLEDGNERITHGALDQTETVARTTTTVEALSEKIDRISQNAEDASEACKRTRQEARRGLEQVHRVTEGMDRLRSQIEINGRKARRLGDRSVEIGTIVELIRGISSRTDMLALNATIESVRAGEHGRGFAVVAEEIRKLSERTAAATRDISTLVEAIQADTHESIRALGEEQSEMEQESQRVREAGAALERISQVAESSAQLVDGISRSTNDQVLAAQDLVRAMQRISDVSQLTMERATQSRESIRGLSLWCERLAPLASAEAPAPGPVFQNAPAEGAVGPLSWRPRKAVSGTRHI